MNQQALFKKIDELLSEVNSKAIFIKDSVEGKMHFQALYNQHHKELTYLPEAVYQIYLPFDMADKLITANYKGTDVELSVSQIQDLLAKTFNKQVFIERSRVDEERNLLDRFQNPEVAETLKLSSFELWKGIMFYFFI